MLKSPVDMMSKTWVVFVDNDSLSNRFIDDLTRGTLTNFFQELKGLYGEEFSLRRLHMFIDEEERLEKYVVTKPDEQRLKSMSSGEQKKALLSYLISLKPDFIILDNPFENLDVQSRKALYNAITELQEKQSFVQLLSRKSDLLQNINQAFYLKGKDLGQVDLEEFTRLKTEAFNGEIPSPLRPFDLEVDPLIVLNEVSVSYGEKKVLDKINWVIRPKEFWELKGKNGSGKTTLLSMITGDNVKGYGQDMTIFGIKKGSGESVWDFKRNIGYFTSNMTLMFAGAHTVSQMVISGFFDSVGLYYYPSDQQVVIANQWLKLLNLEKMRDITFTKLTQGQQRMIMIARAMIKHPPMLILDEPTSGLDDENAAMIVSLINKIAVESETAIIYVSHRDEPGLTPDKIFSLAPGVYGSEGKIV